MVRPFLQRETPTQQTSPFLLGGGPFYSLFSPSVFWERFPMALLAYGSVLAVFLTGTILYDHQVALWAAGIFATTFRFLILSRRLLIDVLLLFCLLWAIAFFLSWIHSQKNHHFLLASLFLAWPFWPKVPLLSFPCSFWDFISGLTVKYTDWVRLPG